MDTKCLLTWRPNPLAIGVILCLLGGCNSDDTPASGSTSASSTSAAPTVSETPPTTVSVGSSYAFQPAFQPAFYGRYNRSLTYSIENKPAWATFDLVTGQLSGTPTPADVGTYSNIVIRATDVLTSTRIAPFAISVTAQGECYPWIEPSTTTLRASSHKVFAHYFSPYPISIDNLPAAQDYYSLQYLLPDGEGGIHASYGGLLRDRPVPRQPFALGVDYQLEDMKTEVRRAIAIGLDGFSYDVLDLTAASGPRVALEKLLAAALAVDPAFKILLVPDMSTTAFGGTAGGTDAEALAGLNTLLLAFGTNPSVLHASDGRVILAPFAAEMRNASFWSNALTQLAAVGEPAALIPVPLGAWADVANDFDGVPLYGASSWGIRTVAATSSLLTGGEKAHVHGLLWMAPVSPQDSRPKDLSYTESGNSAAYRAQWEAAITGAADWAQLITWNDYSENTHIAPSLHTQTAIYDLTAYYTAWFKLGTPPALTRDGMYYFHRAHSMNTQVAPPDLHLQAKAMVLNNPLPAVADSIELVALLSAPATLQISIDGSTSQKSVGAGLQVFQIPLQPGTPIFRIVRNGIVVLELTSATPIDNQIVYQDPLYQAGEAPSCPAVQ